MKLHDFWLGFLFLNHAISDPKSERHPVTEILTYRAFCGIGGDVYPLARLFPQDQQLRRLEAAFWGLVWASHSIGAEAIYLRVSSLLDGEKVTYIDRLYLSAMQQALAKLNQNSSPKLYDNDIAKDIIENVIHGKYEDAHLKALEMAKQSDDGLAQRLMLASLIARYPSSIYSPNTSTILLTDDFAQNLALLQAVRCEEIDSPVLNKTSPLLPQEPAKLWKLIQVKWVAGRRGEASKLAAKLKDNPEYKHLALELMAANNICWSESLPISKQTKRLQKALSYYQYLKNHVYKDSDKMPSIIEIGIELAELKLSPEMALELYSEYVNNHDTLGHFPIIPVIPASPQVFQVVVPAVKGSRVVLPPSTQANIAQDPIPQITSPITETGQTINLSRASPTENALPKIDIKQLSYSSPITSNGRIWQVPESLKSEQYEQLLQKIRSNQIKVGVPVEVIRGEIVHSETTSTSKIPNTVSLAVNLLGQEVKKKQYKAEIPNVSLNEESEFQEAYNKIKRGKRTTNVYEKLGIKETKPLQVSLGDDYTSKKTFFQNLSDKSSSKGPIPSMVKPRQQLDEKQHVEKVFNYLQNKFNQGEKGKTSQSTKTRN